MKLVLALLFTAIISSAIAQQPEIRATHGRLFLGASFGISSINLSGGTLAASTQTTLSLPNLKIGRRVTNNFVVLLHLPGSIYSYTGTGRKRDRGFEGIIPSVQYWPIKKLWVLGGAGLTLDAPAFYDIKNEDERKFYFGGSLLLGTGYEFYHSGKLNMDIQGRMHYGYANVQEGMRTGLAFNLLLGVNWHK